MLPASWKPNPHHRLVRLGSANDGGYVVPWSMVGQHTVLISMGLNDDWTFEEAYLDAGGAAVHCYDHTVTPKFWAVYALKNGVRGRLGAVVKPWAYARFFRRDNAKHHQQRIGYPADGGLSLALIVDQLPDSSSIALKVDIEGSEYRVLADVLAIQNRLSGMVIEFHDVDLHRQAITTFIDRLVALEPAWTHANNWAGVDPAGDPMVLEVAFGRVSQRLVDTVGSEVLTTPNHPRRPEILLQFADDR